MLSTCFSSAARVLFVGRGLAFGIQFNMCGLPASSCSDMIFALLQYLDVSQQQQLAVTLWSLWKFRNNKVWNDVTETSQQIDDRSRIFE